MRRRDERRQWLTHGCEAAAGGGGSEREEAGRRGGGGGCRREEETLGEGAGLYRREDFCVWAEGLEGSVVARGRRLTGLATLGSFHHSIGPETCGPKERDSRILGVFLLWAVVSIVWS